MLGSLPETEERDQQEIALQLGAGLSSLTAKGLGSPEAAEAYTRARNLCEKSGDADRLFVALWNLWLTTAMRDIDAARPLSNQLLILTKSRMTARCGCRPITAPGSRASMPASPRQRTAIAQRAAVSTISNGTGRMRFSMGATIPEFVRT